MAELHEMVKDLLERDIFVIRKGVDLITKKAVDNGAQEFKKTVEAETPIREGKLVGSIKLKKIKKKGRYGYRLIFDGYTNDKYKVPFQLIANTLNSGRKAGISINGKGYSSIEGIKFITKSLSVLRQIDKEIESKIIIGGWSITDTELTLNDGTKILLNEL